MCIIFQTPPFSTARREKLHPMQVAVLKNLHTVSVGLILRKISVSAPDNCTAHTPPCKFGFNSSIVFLAEKIICFCNQLTNDTAAGPGILRVRHLPWPWFSSHLHQVSALIKSIFSDISHCCSNVRTSPLCALMLMNYSAPAAWLRQRAEVRARSLTWALMKNTQLSWAKPI